MLLRNNGMLQQNMPHDASIRPTNGILQHINYGKPNNDILQHVRPNIGILQLLSPNNTIFQQI